MTVESFLLEARRAFHRALLDNGVLRVTAEGVPSNADSGSPSSIAMATKILKEIGESAIGTKLAGQIAGASFERVCEEFVRLTFCSLPQVRPGNWTVGRKGKIFQFDQYSHLDELEDLAEASPELRTALGSDYLIKPDVVVARAPEPDSSFNSDRKYLDSEVATLSPLRAVNNSTPILHASISCKWTLRSDRAQNARTEGLVLVKNRKGRLPHIVVVTGEPTPGRISSIAFGTGEVDCVYHFALPELVKAVKDLGYDDSQTTLNTMIKGKRLRDIADLPIDLAI